MNPFAKTDTWKEKTESRKADILALTERLLHSYLEKKDISLLLSLLAEDILWFGAGRFMEAHGREAVAAYFRNGQKHLIPCNMSQKTFAVRQLADDLWLGQGCSLIRTDTSYKMFFQAYQRWVFIFRHVEKPGIPWEITYLNHSFSYDDLKDYELIPMAKGLRNYRRLKTPKAYTFTESDRNLFFRYITYYLDPLPVDEKRLLMALSLFPCFTRCQAEQLAGKGLAESALSRHWDENPFLSYDPHSGTYTFHPLFQEYLKGHLKKQPLSYQAAVRCKATAWRKRNPLPTRLPVTSLPEDALSPRETFLLQCLSQGLSNKAIARKVNVAEITIKKQLSKLYERFGVKGRTELLYILRDKLT